MHIASMTTPTYFNTNTNTNTNTADSSTTAATSIASPVSQFMAKTDARLHSQLDVANANISSFGKLKSSMADTQLAARALSVLGTNSTVAEVKAAAARFVASFNAAVTAARTAATASVASQSEVTADASSVKADLTRTFSADRATVDALKKMGVVQSADGTLALSEHKFDAAQSAGAAAVRTTLGKMGQAVDKTAAKELANDGHISGSLALLSQRANQVTTNRNAILAMQQRITAAQTTTSSSNYTAQGLAAYLTHS